MSAGGDGLSMPGDKEQLTKPKVLYCEGRSDKAFFKGLLRHLNKSDKLDVEKVQVVDTGGKRRMPDFIKTIPKEPLYIRGELEILAITRDADNTTKDSNGSISDDPGKPEDAFASICKALSRANLPVPNNRGEFTPPGNGLPRVGVFILPNNRDSGALENLCLEAIKDKPEKMCLDKYFKCAKEFGLIPGNLAKGAVHAWLALQKQPDCHFGIASQKGYWPFDDHAFDALKNFLRKLLRE